MKGGIQGHVGTCIDIGGEIRLIWGVRAWVLSIRENQMAKSMANNNKTRLICVFCCCNSGVVRKLYMMILVIDFTRLLQ